MNANKRSIKSNLKKLDTLSDKDIDYSDIPPLDKSFFKRTTVNLPRRKDSVTLRIDHDVLMWFKESGHGYQTLMNAVLKTYAEAHQHHD